MRAATDEDALYALELRLVRTARSVGPLRSALARVAARLVDTQAWERLGYARLSDYAAERAGISARSLQDLAFVGSVLSYSETLRGVLERGELPWTKVRLLARVARRRPIEPFLALARRVMAHELSKAVRRVVPDSVEGGGLDEPRWKSVEIPCSREVHAKWERALWLARRVNGVDGGAAYAAEAIAAEVLSAIPFEEKGAEEPGEEDGGGACVDEPDVDPLPPDPALSTFTDGLEDADAFELDARLRTLLAHEQRLDAQVGPLLAALWRTSAPRQLGYGRLDDYARERLGMDPTRARALVRIEDVARTCPELATAYRAGKLSLVQAQVVLPVLIADVEGRFAARWVAWAQAVTVRRLRDDVARARALLQTDPEVWRATGGLPPDASGEDREIRALPIAPETPEDPTERCSVRLWAPYDIQHFFRAVHASARLYLERKTGRFPTAGEALGAMCDHVFEAWGARFEHKGSVFARDGWRCAAPGCTSTGNLHEHHIVFRSRGGSNARDNRITLCAFHHLRGVHQRYIRITGSASLGLRYEFPLERFGSGGRRVAQHA